MSFEEVKEYFQENRQYYFNAGSEFQINLQEFCRMALEDLTKKMNGEEVEPQLGTGDMDYAAAFTLKIVYEMVADQLDRIDEFADAWGALYSNYLKAFYPAHDSSTYIEGLVNLLSLKNNMARLIVLSNYVIFKKQDDTFTNVSDTFIQSIINNREAKENVQEKN